MEKEVRREGDGGEEMVERRKEAGKEEKSRWREEGGKKQVERRKDEEEVEMRCLVCLSA